MSPGGEPEAYLLLERAGRHFPLVSGQSWAIGRGEGCVVMLDSRAVSRLHALIQRRDGGDYALVDLGSRNGCFVNGQRVSVPRVLHDRDRLTFGDQDLIFRTAPHPDTGESAPDTSTRNAPTAALHALSLTTIMVVDIRDFTGLTQSVPEDVLAQTVGTWFLRVGKIAHRQGSWAQKYIGDAVMAVWLHPDGSNVNADVMRSLRTVNEIQTVTSELHNLLPLPGPLRIGAGINTGPAVVDGGENTAIGETVNAAFRLETATKELGMGLVLGERTYAELRLSHPSPFVPREVSLKGYDLPRAVWATSFEKLQSFLDL